MHGADHNFEVIVRVIQDVDNNPAGLMGVVQVQMPDQCEASRQFYRIKEAERGRNLQIIQNTIANFGRWAETVEAPTIILFPELSVSKEATDWLRDEMAAQTISPNTLIVLGIEQMTTEQFSERAANSDSRTEFADVEFGPNVDRINTAVILAKDRVGRIYCYYQPKCSKSDYESPSQFESKLLYKLVFGERHLIVNICSDFFLKSDTTPLVGSMLLALDRCSKRPRDQRLDMVLLIQKNPSPLDSFYDETVECLFYNQPHQIATSDTIVCAVNSVDSANPGKFGRSNVVLMRRGRPPAEYLKRHALEHFAWCSHPASGEHRNNDLHYARWRLRGAGAISFTLNTNRRPWRPGDSTSIPILQPGLHAFTGENDLQRLSPVPEVFELQEVLYSKFEIFIRGVFHSDTLRRHFQTPTAYEDLLGRVVSSSPCKIVHFLLELHEVPINCDHWNVAVLTEPFRHFLLTLRLLSERYSDLEVRGEDLRADARSFGIIDCKELSLPSALDRLRSTSEGIEHLDVLLLQRVSELLMWDGAPTSLDAIEREISSVKCAGQEDDFGSVTRAPSPQIVDVNSILDKLNCECTDASNIRRTLNGIL